MKPRFGSMLAALAGLAGAAHAQFFTTPGISATFSLSWQEDPAFPHNDNGILEPGERALILTTVSFTGQNTVAEFWPPIGPFSSGVVRGLGGAFFDIVNTSSDPAGPYNGGVTSPSSPTSPGPNANSAGTTGYGVRGGWRLGGNVANGTPMANGLANLGPGQFPTSPPANTTNPVANLHRLGWAPASYAVRSAVFTVRPAAEAGPTVVALYMDLDGGTAGGVAFVPLGSIQFGSVAIPLPPAPCWANCDGSAIPPILNVLDFNCFLNRYAAGDSYANCDGSTTPPVLNVLDFACFLNRFAAGCG